MENIQELLLELDEFNSKKDENSEISQNLENFLEQVAKTGTYIFPWLKVKKLFITKTKNVLANLNLSSSVQSISPSKASYADQLKSEIIERFESFNNAPFTIQRISELLLKPTNNYTQQEKYLRGLEKCLMVVTTIDPSGNKILIENGYTNGKLSESEESFSKLPSTPILNETEIQINKEETKHEEKSENIYSEHISVTISEQSMEINQVTDIIAVSLEETTQCIEMNQQTESKEFEKIEDEIKEASNELDKLKNHAGSDQDNCEQMVAESQAENEVSQANEPSESTAN